MGHLIMERCKKKVFFCEPAVNLGGGLTEEPSDSLLILFFCQNTGIFFK